MKLLETDLSMKIPKVVLYLLLIVLLGLALRTISAYYVDIGSDEIIYSLLPYNIISAGRLSTVEQAPLYFYLVDIGYRLEGGISLLSTRWPSIVFGAFASIAVFLISRELFQHKKAAYVSAFLFAVSGFAIRWNQEMDMTAYFFSLLGGYFFIAALNGERASPPERTAAYFFYFSAGFLALAALAKPIVLLFAPAFLLLGLVHRWKTKSGWLARHDGKLFNNIHNKNVGKVYHKNGGKVLLVAGIIMILVVLPVLAYNYLLYKEKGMTDYYFTVLAGVGSSSVYASQEAELWTLPRFLAITKSFFFHSLPRYDALLFIFGFLGLGLAWKKEKYGTALLVLTMVFLLLYLAGKMGSPTHYVWIPLVLSIFAGYGLIRAQESITQKIAQKTEKIKGKHILALLVALLVILPAINILFVLKEIIPLRGSSIQNVLRDYAAEQIPAEAIVVVDPRIYRGIYAWVFYNKHYLEGTYFPELTQNLNSLPGPKQEIPLYYIECGPGRYCGWKPEDFQRIYGFGEKLSFFFQEKMGKIGELDARDKFIIYQGTLSASPAVYEVIDRTHTHWYTPIGWKYPELAVDSYTPKTTLDKMLHYLGFFILYADVAIALLALPLVVYLLGRRSG